MRQNPTSSAKPDAAGYFYDWPDMVIYQAPEDLPQSLRRACITTSFGAALLHHPLLISLFPIWLPRPIEEIIGEKKKRVAAALLAGDVGRYVFTHERPYRLAALSYAARSGVVSLGDTRASVRFWHAAAEAWIDAEGAEDDPIWTDVLDLPVANRAAMTDSAGRRFLRAQIAAGRPLTVYRGVQAVDPEDALAAADIGWHWSLSADVAAWFARRWLPGEKRKQRKNRLPAKRSYLATTTVQPEHVVALLTGRGEFEVLIRPGAGRRGYAIDVAPAPERPSRPDWRDTTLADYRNQPKEDQP